MQVPEHLRGHAAEVLGLESMAASWNEAGAMRNSLWSVILGLRPKPDGNQWCVLCGEDIATGIAGFGDTPEAAMVAFDKAFREERPPTFGNPKP
jgi:hypothetical protein